MRSIFKKLLEKVELKNTECLSKLICGQNFDDENEIDKILQHLAVSLEKVVNEIAELPSLDNDKLSLYGPYLGRSLCPYDNIAQPKNIDMFY